MNKTILCGRCTRDPEIRYNNDKAVGRFTLAVDRRYKQEGGQTADFISCVAFGKTAEFLEKYGKKGTKFIAEGRIQTGSYEKDGQKVYTTDVVVEQLEFAESKNSNNTTESQPSNDGFMNVDALAGEELPFI